MTKHPLWKNIRNLILEKCYYRGIAQWGFRRSFQEKYPSKYSRDRTHLYVKTIDWLILYAGTHLKHGIIYQVYCIIRIAKSRTKELWQKWNRRLSGIIRSIIEEHMYWISTIIIEWKQKFDRWRDSYNI